MVFACFFVKSSASAAEAPKEHEVKAAFLVNFAKFVEWPSDAFAEDKSAVVIGIIGDDPFGDSLPRMVKGQTTKQRDIEIRRFDAGEDPQGCQVLFLSRSLGPKTTEVLARVQGRPVLTVGETEDFVRQGGVIGFAIVDQSVRFDIHLKVAQDARLKISSKLLAVARSVIKAP
ncbi:MAG: YfiR family protein [Verrucomicrobiales bacterium]|nr:YfiR family protein [Verrucomicrobiales bacterium]